jgi:hypothetical protein
MYKSVKASNYEDIGFTPALSRRSAPRQSLLEAPISSLPEPLNPAVKWTSADVSFCRLAFQVFWNSTDQPEDANVYAADGIRYQSFIGPNQKEAFRPAAVDLANHGQWITFQSPVAFQNAAVLFIMRSWNTTWANGTVWLASSSRGSECNTTAVPFAGTWTNPNTQTVAMIAWSAQQQQDIGDPSCVRDLITVMKTTPGDMRITGFYAD